MAGKVSSDPNIFLLPDLGEGLEEAELVAWKVSEGDSVDEHQIMAEMETDKALVEVPSPRSGTIGTLHGGAGELAGGGFELGLKALQEREGIGGGACEPCDHLVAAGLEATDFAGG
ncbi:MAG: biotin/lipoyl-containing protein, partial [Planctomycetota bacterium]